MGCRLVLALREIVLAAVQQNATTLEKASGDCKSDCEVVPRAAARLDGLALRHAVRSCRRDREIVLAAVKQQAEVLEEANRDRVLAAVQQNPNALEKASGDCKSDREIVLAAVRLDGLALRHSGESCRRDREIVLAAVKHQGLALAHAADIFKSDRQIVAIAVETSPWALAVVTDELLEDESFVVEAKQQCTLVKITLLSGRSTVVATYRERDCATKYIIRRSCKRLGLNYTGNEQLYLGSERLHPLMSVHHWPGVQHDGAIASYQLIVSSQRAGPPDGAIADHQLK